MAGIETLNAFEIIEKKVLDEVKGIEHFEDTRNAYFCIKTEEETFVVFIQGEATFNGGKYLRGLSVDTFNKDGELVYSMNVPYAKVFADLSSENSVSIMVKSVSKESDTGIIEPIFTYSDAHTETRSDLPLICRPTITASSPLNT